MTLRMLVDAAHPEEVRVVVADDNFIEEYEVETTGKEQLKGNIYIGVVDRVEPSLQAAFIDYGGNRNGFLAFGEVHPGWFELPADEKQDLMDEIDELIAANSQSEGEDELDIPPPAEEPQAPPSDDALEDARALALANGLPIPDDVPQKAEVVQPEKKKRRVPIHRRYSIQQVLKPGQRIMVQIVKEERGSKGAALTTYYSLAGRYNVLMPNTPSAGGISRKINNPTERRALAELYDTLRVPAHMGLIIRTAGVGQSPENIKTDYDTLVNLWKKINHEFEQAPPSSCLYEDGSIVVRALRDMFSDEVEEIVVSGKRSFQQAKDYIDTFIPSASHKVHEYRKEYPIFSSFGIERELLRMHRNRVWLPSGGYIVINPTEALVAIDVNSGRATQERNIEETAFKTNLEAAEEATRQIRLRDLAGLVVIDFIDMEDGRNVRAIEREMRRLARRDRARMQIGNISDFGLMEISRQRLRPSLGESTLVPCAHCNGTGSLMSPASAALVLLRRLEEDDVQGKADRVVVSTSAELATFILNHKRELLRELEARYKFQILFKIDNSYTAPDHGLELIRFKPDGSEIRQVLEVSLRNQQNDSTPDARRKRKPVDPRREEREERESNRNQRTHQPRGGDAQHPTRHTGQANQLEHAEPMLPEDEAAPAPTTQQRPTKQGARAERSTSTERPYRNKRPERQEHGTEPRGPRRPQRASSRAATPEPEAQQPATAAPEEMVAGTSSDISPMPEQRTRRKPARASEISDAAVEPTAAAKSAPPLEKLERTPQPTVIKDMPVMVARINEDGSTSMVEITKDKKNSGTWQRWWR